MFIFLLALIFVLGLVIGSFTNCFIWRLYKDESLWNRSYCPKCKHKISWHDNIPLLSFFFLSGKCRNCKKKISWQYPLVEFVIGFLFLASFFLNSQKFFSGAIFPNDLFLFLDPNFVLLIVRDFFIIFTMVVIFVYDLRWMLIPDKLILPASAICFIINLFLGIKPLELLFLAAIGTAFFLLQFIISKGKWIGGGDMRLGLFMGVSLARLDYLVLAIILAYFIGSIVGILLILAKKKEWSSKMPLGVFLSTATIITIFFGHNVVTWYLGLF